MQTKADSFCIYKLGDYKIQKTTRPDKISGLVLYI